VLGNDYQAPISAFPEPSLRASPALCFHSIRSEGSMRRRAASHLLIRLCRGDSGFLAPDNQGYRDEEDHEAQHGDQDVHVLQAHARDPWSERKEDDHRKGVTSQHNSNQCIADDLIFGTSQLGYIWVSLTRSPPPQHLRLDSNPCSTKGRCRQRRRSRSQKGRNRRQVRAKTGSTIRCAVLANQNLGQRGEARNKVGSGSIHIRCSDRDQIPGSLPAQSMRLVTRATGASLAHRYHRCVLIAT
jgi:hypothetical protein